MKNYIYVFLCFVFIFGARIAFGQDLKPTDSYYSHYNNLPPEDQKELISIKNNYTGLSFEDRKYAFYRTNEIYSQIFDLTNRSVARMQQVEDLKNDKLIEKIQDKSVRDFAKDSRKKYLDLDFFGKISINKFAITSNPKSLNNNSIDFILKNMDDSIKK